VDKSKPPSRFQPNPFFFVGRNSHGQWVVRDQRGLCGGLFINRAEALRFALFENGHRTEAVIMVPGRLELHLGETASMAKPQNNQVQFQALRNSKPASRRASSGQREIFGSLALAHR
jgi:hypothetical protein